MVQICADPGVWLALLLVVMAAVVPDIVVRALRDTFSPAYRHRAGARVSRVPIGPRSRVWSGVTSHWSRTVTTKGFFLKKIICILISQRNIIFKGVSDREFDFCLQNFVFCLSGHRFVQSWHKNLQWKLWGGGNGGILTLLHAVGTLSEPRALRIL